MGNRGMGNRGMGTGNGEWEWGMEMGDSPF